MQPEMLLAIHSSHMGMKKCKRRRRDILCWPGMNSEIEKHRIQALNMQQLPKKQPKGTIAVTPHSQTTMGQI